MRDSQTTIADAVERYLRTGDTDPQNAAWPGSFMERVMQARADLRAALVREVRRLAAGRTHSLLPSADTVALTRRKVAPMVRGLFPRVEQEMVLAALETSVVFVTNSNIESLLLARGFDRSAWTIANLYLASVGATLLGDEAPRLVGISEETSCFVSPEYFVETDPFADFIVHEAAHIFHNCKRRTAGLRETRTKEWLLDIEFRKRETFAYSCEAYSRILERATGPSHRRALAVAYGSDARIPDESVDPGEVADIVRDAAAARNGWKIILGRCAPTGRPLSLRAQLRASWAAEDAVRQR